jgi:hypothetical protein
LASMGATIAFCGGLSLAQGRAVRSRLGSARFPKFHVIL